MISRERRDSAIVGIISGLLTFIVLYLDSLAFPSEGSQYFGKPEISGSFISFIAPGIILGLLLTLYIRHESINTLHITAKKILLLCAGFIVSYYIALWFGSMSFLILFHGSVAAGGIIGALAVFLVVHMTIIALDHVKVFPYLLIGGVLGMSYWIGNILPVPFLQSEPSKNFYGYSNFFYLFLTWHTGIACMLGPMILQEIKNKKNSGPSTDTATNTMSTVQS